MLNHLRHAVPSDVRRRGADYYAQGRVHFHEGDATHVLAQVRGSSTYEVLLQVEQFLGDEDEYLKVACECPYFEQECETCKHIWATMLAAEARGFCRGTTATGPTDLYHWDEVEGEEISERDFEHSARRTSDATRLPVAPPAPKPEHWRETFESLVDSQLPQVAPSNLLHYFLQLEDGDPSRGISVEIVLERQKAGQPPERVVEPIVVERMKGFSEEDKNLVRSILRISPYFSYMLDSVFFVETSEAGFLLPRLAATGRLRVGSAHTLLYRRQDPMALLPLVTWEPGLAWSLSLQVSRVPDADYRLEAMLRRGEETRPLRDAWFVFDDLVLWKDCKLHPLDVGRYRRWVRRLSKQPDLIVPAPEAEELLRSLHKVGDLPETVLPDELRLEDRVATPVPVLRVSTGDHPSRRDKVMLKTDLFFAYDGVEISELSGSSYVLDLPKRCRWKRDRDAEHRMAGKLDALGMKLRTAPFEYANPKKARPTFRDLPAKKLPKVAAQLSAEGWRVEADGKLYRQAGKIEIAVTSGIDWFDLEGHVDFGGKSVPFPRLLKALRAKENVVVLDDGTMGVLPEEWLRKYAVLAGFGKAKDESLRFTKGQVGLLDALLAEQPEIQFDQAFQQARERFRSFSGVQPAEPGSEFHGQLRGYQKEGLGWLHFLQEFRFGGCLADDMGLGKTVQVLALLAHRAAHRPDGVPRPSLVVVPKSLVHNWKEEAARFAPDLRVYAHHGVDRVKKVKAWEKFDLVLTTYGTLRRDAALFAKGKFDYGILDESQTVKNASTEQAKAVRLLRTEHRLAMSGTPIENHLGELWSLFDFLNPGMLGNAAVFRNLTSTGIGPNGESRELLSRGLRPFILRRTKSQVAKDLPEKTEQTVYCDLEKEQRKTYDELRDFYRASLAGKIAEMGWSKAKIVVLEALLRLRQAACHPGLIDKKRASESSAKLDVLMPQLTETIGDGHKVLVFSQFTSFLSIVQKRLDRQGIAYEYLDGKTRDRASRVERFQNDPSCTLFLISLKAGGVGLNLTAADYVFLLDPWWNPAVEAQAIDRAHRIGQGKPVFAYRLIARGTVEEKVLELQKTKRELADAIINADNSLIRSLDRKDLDLLLS
jgi:hypothetical protein